jgi:hypothetical protein
VSLVFLLVLLPFFSFFFVRGGGKQTQTTEAAHVGWLRAHVRGWMHHVYRGRNPLHRVCTAISFLPPVFGVDRGEKLILPPKKKEEKKEQKEKEKLKTLASLLLPALIC